LIRQRQDLARQNSTDPRIAEINERIGGQRTLVVPEGGTPMNPGAPSGVQTPKSPGAGMQKDIADLDQQISIFADLAQRAQTPEVTGALGLTGAPLRFMEDTLKMNMLTPAQRAFRADTAIALTDAKKSRLGLNQTRLEQAGLLPALPDANDPGIATKLDAWARAAQRNRDAINAVLSSTNVRVPNASGAPSGGGPGSGRVIRYDAQGNRIRE
jgi:hypothetical protein